jgi:hypothetical protein
VQRLTCCRSKTSANPYTYASAASAVRSSLMVQSLVPPRPAVVTWYG